eukprot:2307399-Pleurochrysis_carterae.AAC.2
MGAPLDVREARVSSMIDRIARSATPLSWWTWGGQEFPRVVAVQSSDDVCGLILAFVQQGRE